MYHFHFLPSFTLSNCRKANWSYNNALGNSDTAKPVDASQSVLRDNVS